MRREKGIFSTVLIFKYITIAIKRTRHSYALARKALRITNIRKSLAMPSFIKIGVFFNGNEEIFLCRFILVMNVF